MAGEAVASDRRLNRRDLDVWKRARHAGEKRTPLRAAGAVRHRIRQKHIRQRVERRVIIGGSVSSRDERQGTASTLRQRLFRKRMHPSSVGDMPMVQARFEPRRMREPAERKRRVDQLPEKKTHTLKKKVSLRLRQ